MYLIVWLMNDDGIALKLYMAQVDIIYITQYKFWKCCYKVEVVMSTWKFVKVWLLNNSVSFSRYISWITKQDWLKLYTCQFLDALWWRKKFHDNGSKGEVTSRSNVLTRYLSIIVYICRLYSIQTTEENQMTVNTPAIFLDIT